MLSDIIIDMYVGTYVQHVGIYDDSLAVWVLWASLLKYNNVLCGVTQRTF